VDRESRPLNETAARARTSQQWQPNREACIARRRARSERLQAREWAGSAGVAKAGRAIRSFTCNAPMRLHGGTATVGGGERILVLLQELLHLSRDPSAGRSRQVEDSRRCGERRPLAAQAHSPASHAITIPSRSADCQAYPAGYSRQGGSSKPPPSAKERGPSDSLSPTEGERAAVRAETLASSGEARAEMMRGRLAYTSSEPSLIPSKRFVVR
jgi:hypothetical protein